eukprot:184675_1
MCEGTCHFGGVLQDGQRVYCTTSCPFWSLFFLDVFYVLIFMIITSSWIDGVISNCYPDTFYLYFVPHLLKQPFFYNIVAFILNISTKNQYKAMIDFIKMLLFDLIYTVVIFGTVYLDLSNIYHHKMQCIVENKSNPDNPGYYDRLSLRYVLYSIIIMQSLFMCLAFLRGFEGLVYYNKKIKRRKRILQRLDQLKAVYDNKTNNDGMDIDPDDSKGQDYLGLYIPISIRNKSFSKSYASIWDISGKFLKSKATIKTTLLGTENDNLNKDMNDEEDDEVYCVICMDKFEINQTIIRLECKHIYHDICALDWFDESASCPICRHQVFKLRV